MYGFEITCHETLFLIKLWRFGHVSFLFLQHNSFCVQIFHHIWVLIHTSSPATTDPWLCVGVGLSVGVKRTSGEKEKKRETDWRSEKGIHEYSWCDVLDSPMEREKERRKEEWIMDGKTDRCHTHSRHLLSRRPRNSCTWKVGTFCFNWVSMLFVVCKLFGIAVVSRRL